MAVGCLYFLISYASKRWEVDSKAFGEALIVFSESEASQVCVLIAS